MEKPNSQRVPKYEKISRDISLSGNFKQIQKAKELLKPVLSTIPTLEEKEIPVILSRAIDEGQINASIIYKGHIIWSRKRIISNLDKIIETKQLYQSKDKVRWIKKINEEGCIPEVPKDFRALLDDYFYGFLVLVCGSKPHHSKAGWIGIYPTLDDFKRFFKCNEYHKPVLEYIPEYMTDAKEIVKDIEAKLFPFRSYVKAQQTKLEEREGEDKGEGDTGLYSPPSP